MSQTIIEKLLKGAEVEWKPLGEMLVENIGGGTPSKSKPEYWAGDIPWASVGDLNVNGNYVRKTRNKISLNGLKHSSTKLIKKGYVVVATRIFPGKMKIADIDLAINQDLRGLKLNNNIIAEYLNYYFQTINFQSNGTIVKAITLKDIEQRIIPVPPLSVQNEIVRILDAFTAHTEELTSELNERKKQYNYYLNKLLTFSDDEVEWKTLKDISDVQRGASPRPIAKYISDVCSGIPWIKIGDAPLNSKYINRTRQRITPEGATKSRILKKGDLILSNSMSYGRPYILELDGAIHDGWASINKISNKILVDFLYYYLNSDDVRNYWENRINSGSVSNLNSVIINSLPMPIPPLSVQKEIVRKLDAFSTLTTSISEGLPREIELRNKQYEYYRDQLLNFPKPANDAIKHSPTNV